MSAELTADAVPERVRPVRGVRYYLAHQTPVSGATLAAGAAGLALLVVGSIVNLTLFGWTPWESVAEAIVSPSQLAIIVVSMGLGLGATVTGVVAYRRMATKPSRDAAISGAALGAQAVVLGAFMLWFRAGDVETFARNFFDFEILVEFWDLFVRGAVNTLILALAGEGIGITLGLVLSVFTISRYSVVRAPARVYINFFRGTPLLWQLSFFFFGIVLGLRLELTAYQVAILVLGLNAGAYSAEIFRSGIQSIDRGQFEAARSLGMSQLKALRLVILPQAVRRVIPPLTNEFVILIKDTSLVSVLGLTFAEQELLAVGREIYQTNFNATAFLGSAAGYLVITLPMIRAVTWLEKRLRSGVVGFGW